MCAHASAELAARRDVHIVCCVLRTCLRPYNNSAFDGTPHMLDGD